MSKDYKEQLAPYFEDKKTLNLWLNKFHKILMCRPVDAIADGYLDDVIEVAKHR